MSGEWQKFLKEVQQLFRKYGETATSQSGKKYERVDLWEVEEREKWTPGYAIRFQLAIASFEFQRFLKEVGHPYSYWLFGKFLCRRKVARRTTVDEARKSTQRAGKKSKLSEIMAKVRRGEKLTKSEREYLSKVMKQVKRRQREELSKKYAKLSLEELRAMFASRSKRSRALDVKKRARRVITKPEDYYLWVRAPSRYDVEGVDTPKRKRR